MENNIIELELKPEELRKLATLGAGSAVRSGVPMRSTPPSERRGRIAPWNSAAGMTLMVAAPVAAAVLMAIGGFRAMSPGSSPLTSVVAAAQIERPVVLSEAPPVRFSNPFDANEVFEFPPGTSADEARDAVAKFLVERARERFDSITVKRRGGRHSISPDTMTAQTTRLSAAAHSSPRRE